MSSASSSSPRMTSSSSSCSHWWHAPIYVAATAALIIAAISTSSSDHHQEGLLLALHRSGFHVAAAALTAVHVSPSSSSFTLFALPDSVLSALPPPSAADILRRHVSPLALPLSALSSLPRGAQIPTLLPHANLTLTSASSAAVAINGASISHPDLFVSGPHIVHGISAPFPALVSKKAAVGPPCGWERTVRVLGSTGYVSFAIGLSEVLGSLVGPAVEQVTVFAPQGGEFDYVAQPAEVLERAVKRHVVVGRFDYWELAEMGVGEEMRTLEGDWRLRITGGERSRSKKPVPVQVDGVEIVEPEVYADRCVVVHGIAGDFATDSIGS